MDFSSISMKHEINRSLPGVTVSDIVSAEINAYVLLLTVQYLSVYINL